MQVHDLERALELNPEHRNAGKYLQTTLLRRARVHETAGRRAQVRGVGVGAHKKHKPRGQSLCGTRISENSQF